MEQFAKTKFSALSSAEMAVIDEILEIRSVKTVLGYFMPSDVMERLQIAVTFICQGNLEQAAYIVRDALGEEEDR